MDAAEQRKIDTSSIAPRRIDASSIASPLGGEEDLEYVEAIGLLEAIEATDPLRIDTSSLASLQAVIAAGGGASRCVHPTALAVSQDDDEESSGGTMPRMTQEMPWMPWVTLYDTPLASPVALTLEEQCALTYGYFSAKKCARQQLLKVKATIDRQRLLEPAVLENLAQAETYLEWIDFEQGAVFAVRAMRHLETAAVAAMAVDVPVHDKLNTAAIKARDVVAWRCQFDVPLDSFGCRKSYITVAERAYEGPMTRIDCSRLGHAHRQEVQKVAPRAHLSETQKKTEQRGRPRPSRRGPRAIPM
jgi:hypothetical protein